MSFWGVNDVLAGAYQYANRTQKKVASGTSFTEQLQKTSEETGASRVDAYTEYLKAKYGNVKIQSVGKDQKSLEKMGKSMRGDDVVIAPNILEQMANDPEKAAYYENKIDYFFNTIIPRETAFCASRGLVFEPSGVVVHEDGTVTYICGCSDSPERVAEVNAINKAKREKSAARRKASLERSQKEADMRRQQMEIAYKKHTMAEALAKRTADTSRITYMTMPDAMSSAAYEMSIMEPLLK
ncbi:MAG: hypothetical protein K2N00_13510 [Lachnospiraceae bacterium]|nr:hypothetical protein [Lachnospiraceae bacterium]